MLLAESSAKERSTRKGVGLVLPPGQGDVMVTWGSDDSLWLDSVHT